MQRALYYGRFRREGGFIAEGGFVQGAVSRRRFVTAASSAQSGVVNGDFRYRRGWFN